MPLKLEAYQWTAAEDPWLLQAELIAGMYYVGDVRIPQAVIDWVAGGERDACSELLWREESLFSGLPVHIKRIVVHFALWRTEPTGDPPPMPSQDHDQSKRTR